MSRCPLCKTAYPDGTPVCKIDGTRLPSAQIPGSAPTAAIPSLSARQAHATQGLSDRDLQSVMPAPSGKRKPLGKGASLASMTDDELTAAAQPEALAARARGDEPPRIATGSGTAAPRSEKRDAWSKPFLEAAPAGLDSKNPESWIGQSLGVYKLLSILGKGGMGCVYRAEHEKLGREVALKVLRSDYSERKDAVARFFQEARAVNKIRHRNIVDITDFVELESGIVFIIMEYLEGAPLTKMMRSQTGIEPVRALGLLIQICDGLAAAHSVGIVHRDLKPDNIMLAKDHRGGDLIKLLDFGVAKLLDKTEEDDIGLQTVAGSVVGTPAFMSPEQAGGSEVDGRADLYSLGAIMYEIFTKQPLFRGKSFGEFVRKHLNETPTRPTLTKAGRDMHPRAEEVILRCLEKNPDNRFQTAQELRTELLSLLATLETSGEMTAHLQQLRSPSAPTGAARPKGLALEPSRDASVPPFYEMPGPPSSDRSGRDSGPPMAQVLVSSSPGHVGTEPPLSSPSNLMQPPVAAMVQSTSGLSGAMHLGYPTGPQPTPYAHTGHSSVHAPPRQKNLRGVGIAGGIAVVALIALLARSGSSDEDAAGSTEEIAAAAQTGTETRAGASDSDQLKVAGAESKAATDAGVGTTATDVQITQPEEQTSRFVVVAMTSDPVAKVFAVGAVSPVCETPCDVEIDTADGGSPSRRDFILRTADHEDATVTINLRAPRESVFTTLQRSSARPETTPPTVDTKVETETKVKTGTKTKTGTRTKTGTKTRTKPKCKVGAQDTFNPFGNDEPCEK